MRKLGDFESCMENVVGSNMQTFFTRNKLTLDNFH